MFFFFFFFSLPQLIKKNRCLSICNQSAQNACVCSRHLRANYLRRYSECSCQLQSPQVIQNLVEHHVMYSERMHLMHMCMFLFTNGGKVAKRFSSSCSSERVFHSWGPRFDPDLTHTRSYCRLVWLGSWSECLVL